MSKAIGIVIALVLVTLVTTTAIADQYLLPFHGTAIYGPLGVHNCGFSTMLKAVDLIPIENQVYASAGGSVSYVCRDGTQVAVRIGDNIYDHLVDTGQKVGDSYSQGQPMGQMVTGSFNTACGYADQPAGTWHVHFCFAPDANGNFSASGYNLNVFTGNWTNGSTTVSTGSQLVSNVSAVPGGNGSMFNIFNYLLAGLIAIVWWIASTFFLPPGTSQTTVFGFISWNAMFLNGVVTVIELTGAALSTFNWWVPGICFAIDMVLFGIQLAVSIYQFALGLIKKIPFL